MAQYNGKPANISRPAAVNIASSTNATPIVITTSANHLLTNGDTVVVSAHETNTAANGQWTIVYLTATTYSLTGSVGNGVGGATGTSTGQGLLPTFERPDDGDAAAVADFNAGLEANGDRAAYLAQRVGAYRHLYRDSVGPLNAAEPPTNTGGWNNLAAYGTALQVITFGAGSVKLAPGDIIRWRLQLALSVTQTTETNYLRVERALNGGAAAVIPGVSRTIVFQSSPNIGLYHNYTIVGTEVLPAAPLLVYQYAVFLNAHNSGAFNVNIQLMNNSVYEVEVLRAN